MAKEHCSTHVLGESEKSMTSVLNSIKKQLGIFPEDECFDVDITIAINTVLASLNQMGVGKNSGFLIQNASTTWEELFGDDEKLEFVKTYVFLKCKLLFDPPQNSSTIELYKEQAKELEWRLYSETNIHNT